MEEFKVGDKVCCSELKCEGIITHTAHNNNTDSFPIRVDFGEDEGQDYYTKDGRYWKKGNVKLSKVEE